MHGFAIALGALADALSFVESARAAQIAAAAIALVLLWSGTEKLRRPMGAAIALVTFGLVRRVDRRLGWIVGTLEVSLGGLILLEPAARAPLLIAAGLFSVFVFLLARAVATGQSEPCHCFSESDEPISVATVVRTLALAVVAAAAAGAPTAPPASSYERLLVIACGAAIVSIVVLGLAVPRVIASGRHTHVLSRLA